MVLDPVRLQCRRVDRYSYTHIVYDRADAIASLLLYAKGLRRTYVLAAWCVDRVPPVCMHHACRPSARPVTRANS